ncbi:MAG: hypothetical protein KA251_07810 [Saprospiraceae bacterium]|nr:hypothetical protein [Candidatus Vicinibacter affinis]MBP6174263.1 hypothetical protein [Saprospiraceae bacterium]MBK6822744.1 hypothetical protein [Candidatus Vicinibacter affinis]MBK7694608.1 hypothetical protein [Candidatus Vicinibacter affinis]MBK7799744.1 hypothetical protein [Candidatus Vicinibacter affinis]
MKLLTLILCLAFSFFEWFILRDTNAGYQVKLPSTPKISKDSLETDLGLIYLDSYMVSEGEDNQSIIYLVNHTQYPSDIDFNDESDSSSFFICQTIEDQLTEQLHGEKVYSSASQMGGVPSRIFLIRYGEDSSVVKMAVIPFKNHLVSLQYFSNYHQRLSNDAERFFNSFSLL